jgi:hypothetical protein
MESTLTVSKELKAYFAGIVDGEGTICISKNNRSSGQLYLRILVVNTHEGILNLLKSIYGGSISTKKRYGVTHKKCGGWQVSSRKAEYFLLDIYEYLIIKKGQAELAFKFIETFELGKKTRGFEPERELMKKQMTFLNTGKEAN